MDIGQSVNLYNWYIITFILRDGTGTRLLRIGTTNDRGIMEVFGSGPSVFINYNWQGVNIYFTVDCKSIEPEEDNSRVRNIVLGAIAAAAFLSGLFALLRAYLRIRWKRQSKEQSPTSPSSIRTNRNQTSNEPTASNRTNRNQTSNKPTASNRTNRNQTSNEPTASNRTSRTQPTAPSFEMAELGYPHAPVTTHNGASNDINSRIPTPSPPPYSVAVKEGEFSNSNITKGVEKSENEFELPPDCSGLPPAYLDYIPKVNTE